MNPVNRLTAIAFVATVALLGYFISTWIASGNLRLVTLAASFAGVLALAIVILKRWEVGIFAFFVWVAAEDLLRKYIGNEMALYLAKDALVGLAYAAFFIPAMLRWRSGETLKNPLALPLAVWFVWALVEVFNPGVGHPLEPLIGFRMSFFYVPMIYLGYRLASSPSKLSAFLKLNIAVGTVVAALGVIQSVVGLQFLNPTAAVPYLRLFLVRSVTDTGAAVPRPNSVFVDAGRLAQYLYVIVLLCLGTLAADPRLARDRLGRRPTVPWLWLSLVLLCSALYVSGQRAAIYLVLLAIPTILIFRSYETRGRRGAASGVPLVKLGVFLLAGFLGLWFLLPQRAQATYDFYAETLTPAEAGFEVPERVHSMVWQFKYALSQSPIVGHGTGTNSLGRQYLYGTDNLYMPDAPWMGGVEMGYGAIIWEWGIIGLAVWLWWVVSLTRRSVAITMSLAGTRLYWLAVMISYYAFSILILWFFLGLQVYQNYITAAFLWFLVGILMRLPKLAEEMPSRGA
jgi:hypothetical protein